MLRMRCLLLRGVLLDSGWAFKGKHHSPAWKFLIRPNPPSLSTHAGTQPRPLSSEDHQRKSRPQQINKGAFSAEEEARLREAVEREANAKRRDKWKRVAAIVGTRDARSCRERWANMREGHRTGEWTKEESEHLVKLYEKYKFEWYKWRKIALRMKMVRTPRQCRTRWLTLKAESSETRGDWTAEEDKLLKGRVELLGVESWPKIAEGIPGRSARQAHQRWTQGLGGGQEGTPPIYGVWTADEDGLLKKLYEEHGKKWSAIAARIPGRTVRQIVARWLRTLNPRVVRKRWASEDDKTLKHLVEEWGFKWRRISERLPGRSPFSCRERWTTVLDPKVRKGRWSQEETRKLIEIVPKQYDPDFNWAVAADHVTTRHRKQCSQRYRSLLKRGLVKPTERHPGSEKRNEPRIYESATTETTT